MSYTKNSNKTKNPTNILTAIFWTLVAIFIFIVIIVGAVNYLSAFRAYGKFLIPSIITIFLLLSITLLILAIKENIEGIFGKFLILTGASAVGIAAGILLENFLTGTIGESIFFIIGVVIAPIGFLVGIIGSIVFFAKKRVL